ncbi:MAG: fluoride efflux transporter CrcB [Bacteroidetes bacterium]|jgi:CrcB protein|nr:fluoride efflux transporter CrcB [Bacteroidota bacterium]
MKNFLLAGLGGAIGTMMRYAAYILFKSSSFPLGTLLINITGSFIIGLVFGLSLRNAAFENNWKVFLATGICGGFTTFSAFSMENVQMLQEGKYLLSGLYIVSSVVAGMFAAWLGYKLSLN